MPEVSEQRFRQWFDELAAIGHGESGWNRVAWTEGERDARAWFTGVTRELGLEQRQDGAGNLWAVTPDAGSEPWVCVGSHLDTQPDGGAYDGALGIVAALEATAAVLESGAPRARPIAVAAFVDEEGARFRTPTFGSLAITGALDVEHVLRVMGDAAGIYGVTAESLRASTRQLAHVASFLEVHVEQGRALVDRGLALGIADVLAPRQRWRVEFAGESNHAGTTPMPGRRDALVAAARFVLAAEQTARAHPGAVATVGRLEIRPGSTNSIPGHVAASLDVRALSADQVEAMVAELRSRFAAAAFTPEARSDGARFSDDLRTRLAAACAARGVAAGDLPSYAGHDAGILAAHVPAAMVFVRNPTGASHTPAEGAAMEDCVAAAAVLAETLAGIVG